MDVWMEDRHALIARCCPCQPSSMPHDAKREISNSALEEQGPNRELKHWKWTVAGL